MKRPLFFALSVLGTTSARAADIATTYHFSPDLTLEGNPIVVNAGMNFPLIIGLNIAVLIAFSTCTLYWWRTPLTYAMPDSGNDVWAFAAHNYLGRNCSRSGFVWRFMTSWPKNWRMVAQMVGVVGPVVLVAVSVLAIFSWYALHGWQWSAYRFIYGRGYFMVPYGLLIPLYVYATAWFFRSEWQHCLAHQEPA